MNFALKNDNFQDWNGPSAKLTNGSSTAQPCNGGAGGTAAEAVGAKLAALAVGSVSVDVGGGMAGEYL